MALESASLLGSVARLLAPEQSLLRLQIQSDFCLADDSRIVVGEEGHSDSDFFRSMAGL